MLAGVLAVVSFFTPRTFRVERSVLIQATPEKAYALVADLKAWKDWGGWFEPESGLGVTYLPVTTGVGAEAERESKLEGNGQAMIPEAPTK